MDCAQMASAEELASKELKVRGREMRCTAAELLVRAPFQVW